jgi:alpha/beta superfamily hydrolase
MMSAPTLSVPALSPEITTLRAVHLNGPAGRLEALLNTGASDPPCAALVCHPHPLAGGTMHNKVSYHAMKVLNAPEWGLRWPVLRFNFRGAGLSEGAHEGRAESGDVLAALDWLEAEYKRPVVVVGFSFGAAMALYACCDPSLRPTPRPNLRALIALGLPTQVFGHPALYPFLSDCKVPKLFLSGDRDRFASATELKQVAEAAAAPATLALIPGADHSFSGQIDAMQKALFDWLKEHTQ